MRYNQCLYRLSVKAVLMTDIVKYSISATNIIPDPINGTSLMMKFKYAVVMHSVMYSLRFGNLDNLCFERNNQL